MTSNGSTVFLDCNDDLMNVSFRLRHLELGFSERWSCCIAEEAFVAKAILRT